VFGMAQITAGIKFDWGVGTEAAPPTDWTHIAGITDLPAIGNDEPETYETTSLDNLEYKTYIAGLKDTGGAQGLTANDTPAFRAAWEAFEAASDPTNTDIVWARIVIPAPLNKEMHFKVQATPLGFGGAAINGVLTTTAYITMLSEPVWVDYTPPTGP